MPEQQLDLFSAAGIPAEQPLPQALVRRPAVADRPIGMQGEPDLAASAGILTRHEEK
jgi:hypothetical protein